MIVEDYVPPSTITQAFATAGLMHYVETLQAHAPLPTLGELITSGRRLLVFAEMKGASPAWYMPAFSFIQDTPLGALHPGQLSCARYRGKKDSPRTAAQPLDPTLPSQPHDQRADRSSGFPARPHLAMHPRASHSRSDRGRRLLRAHRRDQSRTRAQLQALSAGKGLRATSAETSPSPGSHKPWAAPSYLSTTSSSHPHAAIGSVPKNAHAVHCRRTSSDQSQGAS